MNTVDRVGAWHVKCGNELPVVGSDEYWSMLRNQALRMREEVEEVIQAIEQQDLNNLTKELCDVDVTLAGAISSAQSDHEGAMVRVLDNNDGKVTTYYELAGMWLTHHKQSNPEHQFCIETTPVKATFHYCVKRTWDNKIMKPYHLPSVDLTTFQPKRG